LVEESRTNLLQYSEDFTDPTWIAVNLNGTLTPDQAVAPDGTMTAELYTEDTTTNGRYFAQPCPVTSGKTYTVSIWAKQASGTRYAGLVLPVGGFGANCIASFTLSGAGSYYITTSGTGTTADIQQFPNGWYRCWLTSQATATASPGVQIRLSSSSTNGTQNYTGDGTSGIYVWGAQLEADSFPTSYIKNVDAVLGAIRAADVASISGSNFSSWYRQDEGTVFCDSTRQFTVPTGDFPVLSSLNDGTTFNRINNSYITSNLAGFLVTTGGVNQASIYPPTTASRRQLATSFAINSFSAAVNGGNVGTDASGTVPTVSQLRIGDMTGNQHLNGAIRRLTYWPVRLENNVLQAITQ